MGVNPGGLIFDYLLLSRDVESRDFPRKLDEWKEVKLSTISAVEVSSAKERLAKESKESRRVDDPVVKLKEHSYQAGLWDADTMALHQYTEGITTRDRSLSTVEFGQ